MANTHQILAGIHAGISELKKNPITALANFVRWSSQHGYTPSVVS